jgi:hypothetical protein
MGFDGALDCLWKAVSPATLLPCVIVAYSRVQQPWEAERGPDKSIVYLLPLLSLTSFRSCFLGTFCFVFACSRMFRSLVLRPTSVLIKSKRILSCTRSYSTTTFGNMTNLGGHSKKHKVTIVGSGNWYAQPLPKLNSTLRSLLTYFSVMQGLNDCQNPCREHPRKQRHLRGRGPDVGL